MQSAKLLRHSESRKAEKQIGRVGNDDRRPEWQGRVGDHSPYADWVFNCAESREHEPVNWEVATGKRHCTK